MAGQADSLKSILFALFANSDIAVAKGIAAFITGSGAMLAEAIHSVADAAQPPLDSHRRAAAGGRGVRRKRTRS